MVAPAIRAKLAAGTRATAPILRMAIGALFVWAGAAKAMDPDSFAQSVHGYRLLPEPAPALAALYLPWLEIACGVCLLCRRAYVGALVVLLALMSIFVAANASAWIRGIDVSCGCFGGSGQSSSAAITLRNLLILLAMTALAREAFTKPAAQSMTARHESDHRIKVARSKSRQEKLDPTPLRPVGFFFNASSTISNGVRK